MSCTKNIFIPLVPKNGLFLSHSRAWTFLKLFMQETYLLGHLRKYYSVRYFKENKRDESKLNKEKENTDASFWSNKKKNMPQVIQLFSPTSALAASLPEKVHIWANSAKPECLYWENQKTWQRASDIFSIKTRSRRFYEEKMVWALKAGVFHI